MSEYIVKVLESQYITHDVKRFKVEKPKGYTFIPGQATDVSINLPEWKKELRPFTFTSLNEWEYLEFMIKIYTGHEGVTNMLGRVNAGDELILHDVFGAIQYKGPGVFIAGGAGITPFIAILRQLFWKDELSGNKLIFSNKTSSDVIMREELFKMLGENFINVYTRENAVGFLGRRIDRDFLIDTISNFSQPFYICGPDDFVTDVSKHLMELGALAEALVIEK
jgi:ferredoxin-NADP reductase